MSELKKGDYITAETVEFPAVHPGTDWHAKVSLLEMDHGKTKTALGRVGDRVTLLESRFDAFGDRFNGLEKSIDDMKRHLVLLVDNQLTAHASFARQDNIQRIGILMSVLAGAISGLFAGIVSVIAIKYLGH